MLEEKLNKIKDLISEWDAKTGHDRCWYFPDLFRKIAEIVEVKLTNHSELPLREEFEEGCRKYQEEEYKK